MLNTEWVVDLAEVNLSHIDRVGGKNASTGEMIQALSGHGIQVPGGFATTVSAFHDFLAERDLAKKIARLLSGLDTANIRKLNQVSAAIRQLIVKTTFPPENVIVHLREMMAGLLGKPLPSGNVDIIC